MSSCALRRSAVRIIIVVTICAALLPIPNISLLVQSNAQLRGPDRSGTPRPGKPEGTLPDLADVMRKSHIEGEIPAPLPSSIRSPKIPLQAGNGRWLGGPDTRNGSIGQVRRAHARGRANPSPPPIPDDQVVANFFSSALLRAANAGESSYWYDQLRVGYGQGQESLRLAVNELGKTLFESAEYAARNRDNHGYVYDLYKAYLMRDPDTGGWANWEAAVPIYGREYVRRGFEDSAEFANLIAGMTPNSSASSSAASLISARAHPRNQPGNGMLTRDANWSVPLLSLPGRAGLDLGLTLSYSSMVWTPSGPYIYFDEDNGFPSPGFRLGFPTVQRKVFDAQTARNAYLLITGSGQRVELRQVGTSNVYDAADSSYLRLTDNGSLVVQTTDGTRMTFTYFNGEFRCTEIKDRNGNYITVNYNSLAQITNITDTLGRVITFNYDSNANLLSITQAWNGQPSHQWATFGWTTQTVQPSFGTLSVVGTFNNAVIPVLMQVGLPDGTRYNFEYTSAAQVAVIRRYRADNSQPFYTVFQYETTSNDCPRLSQSRVAAENWTSLNGVPGEVTTYFAVDPDGACRLTAPDGTVYKEYYGTGWQAGLTTLSEIWSGGVKQKWTATSWTQDNTSVGYEINPRVTESNIYDASGNRRRTETIYTSYNLPAPVALPTEIKEYDANAISVLRRTTITYFDGGQNYIDRRVLGLLREVIVYDGNNQPQSKVWYDYDWDNDYWTATPQPATQHDASGVPAGRGNLCWIGRWDVADINNVSKITATYTKYNRTGAVIRTDDHYGHGNSISYADSFSDAVNRNTFAYPTTITDADGNSSYVQFNFDFGATTRTQSPAPANQSQGAIRTVTYDSIGRTERSTTVNNGAYTRYVYGPNYVQSFSTVNNIADEAYGIQVFDGVGRIIASAGNHPGSTGGYRAQMTIYDLMGRAIKTSNPAEMTSTWVPAGDDAAGWLYTQQTYDWKGRPLVQTNPDNTRKEMSYAGCGCAGGEVVTFTDEGTIFGGVAKRRQKKVYSDVFGRTVKTEVLNWQGGSVYASTVNTYNVRDQITQVREYAGAEGSGTYQDTVLTYDGYGRLQTKHVPEQNAGTATTWAYNADDTIQSITDARGAYTTFTYNNARHLPNVVTHTLAGSNAIVESFSYDAAGNRTSMTDNSGTTTYQYNQLSQMTSETRTFSGLGGSYTLAYDYTVGGQLKSLTDHTNQRINYVYDNAGRISALTGTNYTYGQFINSITYRAWDRPRQITYGNGRTETVSYNARLQSTHYEIPAGGGVGTAVSIDYQYYDDGRMKYSHDLLDNRFDRSYEFDHVGRLTKALSGAEARGEPFTENRPFNETATYDAFNHLNVRSSEHWSKSQGFGSNDTYSNNRRVGWAYDSNGNLLTDADRQHTYDAAGRTSSSSWTGGYFNEFSDGDGQRVKTVEANLVTYYLRSTILGGQIIEELTSSGAKQKSMIYGGQKVIGYDWGNGNVSMLHEDPSGVTIRSSISQSPFVNYFSELDPWGAEVYTWDPYLDDPAFSGGRGESGPTYGGFGDISMPSNGCMLDGSYTLCDFVYRNGEALALELSVGGRTKQFSLTPGLLGLFWVKDAGQKLSKAQTPPGALLSAGDVIVTNTDDDGLGHWALINLNPQDTTRTPLNSDEISTLLSEVKKLLSNPDCAKFIKSVLSQLKVDTGRQQHDTTDILQLFQAVQDGRGFDWQSDLNAQARGGGGPGNASITIKPVNDFADLTNKSPGFMVNRARTIIHELFHVAGYDHNAMALAAYNIGEKFDSSWRPWRGDFPDPKDSVFQTNDRATRLDGAYSGFFGNVLNQHCK